MVISLHDSVRAYLPNCGLPDVFAMQHRGLIQNFEPLTALLIQKDNVNSSKCAPMHLASVVAHMRRFLDRNFGRGAKTDPSSSSHFTIWPAHVFHDYSPEGSLHCILRSAFIFMNQHQLDSIDFDNPADYELNVKLLHHITESLRSNRHLPEIYVHFSSITNEKELEKLQLLAKRHGINVVSNPKIATHILYQDPPHLRENQTDNQVLVRVLDSAGFDNRPHYFVHWFYHPDSYNDWLPQEDVLGHIYTPKPRLSYHPWHLQARWIRDLDLYNEWMNELDYEMSPSFTDFVGISPYINVTSFLPCLVRIHLHRNTYPSNQSNLRVPFSESPTKTHDCASTPPPPSSQPPKPTFQITKPHHQCPQQTLLPLAPNFSLPTPSHDPPITVTPERNPKFSLPSTAQLLSGNELDIDEDQPLVRHVTTLKENAPRHADINIGNGVVVPSFSSWFDLDSIHDIEKKSLPEFFSATCFSKTPVTYKEIRNFIVLKWRASPNHILTSSNVRRCVAGDACSILRLHSFLSHWRLINYMSQEDVRPSQSYVHPPPVLPALLTHHEVTKYTLVRPCFMLDDGSIAKVEDYKIIKSSTEITRPSGNVAASGKSVDFGAEDAHNSVRARAPRKPAEYHCDSCGTDCSDLRFHCVTQADMDLCPDCYENGRQSTTGLKHHDFIQMGSVVSTSPNDDMDANTWTENESLLLSEALEMYGDNWELVADHVGSKSQAQCVTHFSQFPIEDPYLKKSRAEWWHQHPKQNPGNPSPFEVLRQAGAGKEALDVMSTKSGRQKVYSGDPPVSSEDGSTIVPFVTDLMSSCYHDVIDRTINRMGIAASGMDEPYEKVVAKLSEDDDAGKVLSDKPQDVFSGKLYSQLKAKIPKAASVASSEFGRNMVNTFLIFSGKGPESASELQDSVCLENSDCDVVREFRDELDENEDLDIETGTNSLQDASSSILRDHDASKLVPGTSSVAILCSSVVAAQHVLVEDVEIGRLTKMSVEMKLERVRRKIRQLANVVEGEQKIKMILKRRREQDLRDCIRKKQRLLSKTWDVVADGDAASVVGPCDTSEPVNLSVQGRSGGGSFLSKTAATPISDSLRGPKLPDFSGPGLKLNDVEPTRTIPKASDQNDHEESENVTMMENR